MQGIKKESKGLVTEHWCVVGQHIVRYECGVSSNSVRSFKDFSGLFEVFVCRDHLESCRRAV